MGAAFPPKFRLAEPRAGLAAIDILLLGKVGMSVAPVGGMPTLPALSSLAGVRPACEVADHGHMHWRPSERSLGKTIAKDTSAGRSGQREVRALPTCRLVVYVLAPWPHTSTHMYYIHVFIHTRIHTDVGVTA